MTAFNERRRQQFITEGYFSTLFLFRMESIGLYESKLLDKSNDDDDRRRLSFAIANEKYMILSLRYTAGEPIEPLRNGLEQVVAAYENYAKMLRAYECEPAYPAFGLQDIGDFERIAQLVGLAILLHRRDLIPRIHALIEESAYDGVDAVYEELISHALPDRPYLEHWFHKKPYLHLLNATDLEDLEGKSRELQNYCKEWFPAMKPTPWHNSHLRMTETDGDYFGYWAFEIGAIAYLYKIDDQTIDHMIYPRDLVAWARANEHLSETTPEKFRCDGGDACPKTGYWWTHAKKNSRRHFKQGEIMPIYPNSSYGMTIWQWDVNQGD